MYRERKGSHPYLPSCYVHAHDHVITRRTHFMRHLTHRQTESYDRVRNKMIFLHTFRRIYKSLRIISVPLTNILGNLGLSKVTSAVSIHTKHFQKSRCRTDMTGSKQERRSKSCSGVVRLARPSAPSAKYRSCSQPLQTHTVKQPARGYNLWIPV